MRFSYRPSARRRGDHLLPESPDRVVHAAVGRRERIDHDLADARAAESHHPLGDLVHGARQREGIDDGICDERQQRQVRREPRSVGHARHRSPWPPRAAPTPAPRASRTSVVPLRAFGPPADGARRAPPCHPVRHTRSISPRAGRSPRPAPLPLLPRLTAAAKARASARLPQPSMMAPFAAARPYAGRGGRCWPRRSECSPVAA